MERDRKKETKQRDKKEKGDKKRGREGKRLKYRLEKERTNGKERLKRKGK